MSKSHRIQLLLCLLLALLPAACQVGRSRAPLLSTGIGEKVSAGFAPYVLVPVDVQPQLPAYGFDLAKVINAGQLQQLRREQQTALAENGFVVTAGYAYQIYDVYQEAEDEGWPIFVTSDALLHTHHVLYDYALRLAEMNRFIADAGALTRAMLDASIAQYKAAQGEKVKAALLRNVAYFSVAAHLLELEVAGVPGEARRLAEAELALIEAHDGLHGSPLLTWPDLKEIEPSRVMVDYSQYVPRGHYTRNEELKRYFKAMMWYGQTGLRLRPGAAPDEVELGRRYTRQAILMSAVLTSAQAGSEPALDVWARIYEPTVFFVGKADDLVVHDYGPLIHALYGETLDPAALEEDGQLDEFIAQALALRPPAIISSLVVAPPAEARGEDTAEEVTKGYHFMSQRFVPDSYILQQLVYDKVKEYQGQGQPFTWKMTPQGPLRTMPRGLDVPAVLGSDRALAILEAEADTEYDGYGERMAALRQQFAALPAEQWVENLYWSWLHTLRPLLAAKGQGYPSFMQTPAWTDKDLHTFLGSWAELRHDTILYAKQGMTMVPVSLKVPVSPPPAGYVEPQVELYARLAALTRQMIAGLGDRGLLSDEYRGDLERMEDLLLDLKAISEKELSGEELTAEEQDCIRTIGNTLEGIVTLSAKTEEEITSETDMRMAVIADVHADPNEPAQVLEEGVGDAMDIYVLVPAGDGLVLAHGALFSYYEFKQPLADRLTDEAWQALKAWPARPAWTASFVR